MSTIRIAGLACSLAFAGCATAREQTSVVTAASVRAGDQPTEERQPAGWPPYYPPRKTQMGVAAIATTQRPALILVHTRDLAEQWRERIAMVLGQTTGIIAGGESRLEL